MGCIGLVPTEGIYDCIMSAAHIYKVHGWVWSAAVLSKIEIESMCSSRCCHANVHGCLLKVFYVVGSLNAVVAISLGNVVNNVC